MPATRILIAPDSFKGTLSADQAAEAMARGARKALPSAMIELCPLSDGGEGVGRVLVDALGGSFRAATVTGPLGEPIEATWGLLRDGTTAIVESAEAIGLARVPELLRAPLRTTSYGVGELIRFAMTNGARRVLVGLGGTATTDAGVGMAQALGMQFVGLPTPATGGSLAGVERIDSASRESAVSETEIIVLCDVDNPLLGPEGSARVYGPQKGATEGDVLGLERGFSRIAALAGDAGNQPGDGAAGGLGYGLRVFAGARLTPGIDFVLDAVGFDSKLEGCDLVLTGEGRLDDQTKRGKVIAGVGKRCRRDAVPLVALVGLVTASSTTLESLGVRAAFGLCDGAISESEAKSRASELLTALGERAARSSLAAESSKRR